MSSNKRKPLKKYQAFFLAYELSDSFLKLKLCRLITLARVRLGDVDYLRVGTMSELFTGRRGSRRWWKCRIWFCSIPPVSRRLVPRYLLATRRGRRQIFLRLEPFFHYLLRSAIGRVQARENKAEEILPLKELIEFETSSDYLEVKTSDALMNNAPDSSFPGKEIVNDDEQA